METNLFSLQNKKIFVTGGSRGIGAGIVQKLAAAGATVAFTYSSQAEAAKKLFESLPKGKHLTFQMNVNDESSVQKTFDELLEKWGSLDGLVNNAGITRDQLLLRMKTADMDDVWATNMRGTFLCTRAATKVMLKNKKGSIVQITSVIGHSGNPGQANYAASKAAIDAFTKSIAQEVGSRNIRLNCVAPGFIDTEMTAVLSEEQKKAILQKVPLQKFGSTADVAHAVLFLLSDESTYITGQTLHVNGGMYM